MFQGYSFPAVSWRVVSFCLALLAYGLFGSPTPDAPGVIEAAISLLFLLSLRPLLPPAYLSGWVFLTYGFTACAAMGVLSGHPGDAIVRDVIPFLFLLLPLFFGGLQEDGRKALPVFVCGIGWIFSARTLESFAGVWSGRVDGTPPDFLYLANSPEVLFSAVCLLGGGIALVLQQKRLGGLALVTLGVVPLLAMGLMVQRASFGFLALAAFAGFAALLWRRPRVAVLVLVASLAVLGGAWDMLAAATDIMADKTRLVGLNSRVQEWEEVIRIVSQSPVTVLFGLGFGARFENPAVGGESVLYTHNLFSELWLKTGLIGVFLACVYFLDIIRRSFQNIIAPPVLVWALSGPILISSLLYASHKSLGFGLLLLVLAFHAGEKTRPGKRGRETLKKNGALCHNGLTSDNQAQSSAFWGQKTGN
jgi:O-antigen ligase